MCRMKRKYRTFVCKIIKLPQVYILYINLKHIKCIYSYHDSFMYKLPAFYAYLQRILFTNFMESCRHACFSVPLPSFMIPFCGRHCQGNVQAVCAFTCQYRIEWNLHMKLLIPNGNMKVQHLIYSFLIDKQCEYRVTNL